MHRLIAVSLLLTLVACGGTSTAVSPPTSSLSIPTPTVQALATPTLLPATLTPLPLIVIPTPPGLTCGTVEVRDSRVINPTDAQAAENCFWQAYQQCAAGRDATMAVRESTDETPYTDSTQGPAYLSVAIIRRFTVIIGDDGACALRVSRGMSLYRRTQAGTPFAGPGAATAALLPCTGMTRSVDGVLHVAGCEGPSTTYDIPHP